MVVLLLVYYMKQEGCGHESHDDSRQWRYSGPSMFTIAIICLDSLLIHTYNRSDPHLQPRWTGEKPGSIVWQLLKLILYSLQVWLPEDAANMVKRALGMGKEMTTTSSQNEVEIGILGAGFPLYCGKESAHQMRGDLSVCGA